MNSSLISLCTDYGHGSEGVGLLHGAIFAVTRHVQIVDLTHDVAPFSTLEGARELETVLWMPIGTHVCVVDPGVGGQRHALAIETGRGDILLGPDNGVLIPAAKRLGGIRQCFAIQNPRVMRNPVSFTFHGRDVFATCAGWLANGVPITDVGDRLPEANLECTAFVDAQQDESGQLNTLVTHINRFGSASLNVFVEHLAELGVNIGDMLLVRAGSLSRRVRYTRTFSDVPVGEVIALADPYERLALAVNMGSYAALAQLSLGDPVVICRA